jgi:hypothetical protein
MEQATNAYESIRGMRYLIQNPEKDIYSNICPSTKRLALDGKPKQFEIQAATSGRLIKKLNTKSSAVRRRMVLTSRSLRAKQQDRSAKVCYAKIWLTGGFEVTRWTLEHSVLKTINW